MTLKLFGVVRSVWGGVGNANRCTTYRLQVPRISRYSDPYCSSLITGPSSALLRLHFANEPVNRRGNSFENGRSKAQYAVSARKGRGCQGFNAS
jgi:hypothetical protein